MTDNPFWVLAKELYPYFLMFCALLGLKRISRGALERLRGEEDAIGDAINDIIVGFFYAHIAVALVASIWYVMENVGSAAEETVRTLIEMNSE